MSGPNVAQLSPNSMKLHGMRKHFKNEVQFLSKLECPQIIKVFETANLIPISKSALSIQNERASFSKHNITQDEIKHSKSNMQFGD